MFDIGFSEVILIFGLALVVLGPEKLPKLAATIGRWVGRARAMARQFQDQLESEAESLKSGVNEVKQNVESTFSEVRSTVNTASESIGQIHHDLAQVSIDSANEVSAIGTPAAGEAPAAAAAPEVPAVADASSTTPAAMHPPGTAPAHYEHNER